MRSQKISNKAPRPFKNQFAERGWSGGNRNDAFIAPAKLVRAKKPAVPSKETSAEVAPEAPPAEA